MPIYCAPIPPDKAAIQQITNAADTPATARAMVLSCGAICCVMHAVVDRAKAVVDKVKGMFKIKQNVSI